ncbi:ABC transporter substrate-binding protein [Fibrella sp. WM1]|uniref:ABC transporter substrate-binding protein n=1 Tax=Fibrella musci TaxID=3242485 RepID=UPI0035222888
MTTIGLLVPQSSLYPTLPFDLTDGLKAGLAQAGLTNTRVVMEAVNFGTDSLDVQAKAQKLLLQEGADVVIGMLSRRVSDALAPMFAAANRLLLLLDVVGEFFTGLPPSPHIYHHSLQASMGSWLMGRDAAALGHVMQVASFYEAGYLQGYAQMHGVLAGGSQMGKYVVTAHKAADVTLAEVQTGIAEGKAQSITALYSGDMASQFYELYAQLPERLPTWVAPLALEEQLLATVPYRLDGIRGYVPWSERLTNPLNDQFQETLRRRGRRPNLFSLLAYEAAAFLPTYLDQLGTQGYAELSHLDTFTFDSPRGPIAMNPTTHYSAGPMYAATLEASQSGHCQLADLTPDPAVGEAIDSLLAQGLLPNYANWYNTYLCI